MRKTLIAAVAIAALMTTSVMAQTPNAGLGFAFNVRDNSIDSGEAQQAVPTAGAPWGNDPNGGDLRDGGVLRIQPQFPGGQHAPPFQPIDTSIGVLHLYAVLGDVAGADDKLSSVGFDIAVTRPVPAGPGSPNNLLSMDFEWMETGALVGAGAATSPWSGTNTTGSPIAGVAADANTWSIDDVRAVAVPVVAGPPVMYDTLNTIGLEPGGPYRIARMTVRSDAVGASPRAGVGDSTFGVKLAVDSLLITRVTSDGLNPVPEVPDFGFVGGAFEPTDTNGATIGSSSPTDDALVEIRMKGDANGDGVVNNIDFGAFLPASAGGAAALDSFQRYVFDYNLDYVVNNIDFGGFLVSTGL